MERSGFFNSVKGDRKYFSQDIANKLKQYFTNGIFNNGCNILGENNNMSVNINIGSANIEGYSYDNDSKKLLLIENADGVLNRVDNVVLRLDLTNREITSQVIKGEFATEAVAPALVRSATIYDLRLAKISIPAGTTTITQDLITDTRFINSDCGNVICAIETPDTEELYSQLYAKANKLIEDSQKSFNNWFETIQNTLDGDVAGNLANRISTVEENSKLKTYTTTLTKTSWTLNETTELYEYIIENEEISINHSINIDPATLEELKKFKGRGEVKSYEGGIKITSTELPDVDINVVISYRLATAVSNDEENEEGGI